MLTLLLDPHCTKTNAHHPRYFSMLGTSSTHYKILDSKSRQTFYIKSQHKLPEEISKELEGRFLICFYSAY